MYNEVICSFRRQCRVLLLYTDWCRRGSVRLPRAWVPYQAKLTHHGFVWRYTTSTIEHPF